jgi:hypothetical protein
MRKLILAVVLFGGLAALIWSEAVGQPADVSPAVVITAEDVARVVDKARTVDPRTFFECLSETDGRGAC